MSTLRQQVAKPQDDSTTYIYGLVDPITGYVRYIGKANNPKYRLSMHLTPGELKDTSHKNSWLHGLLNKDKKPELIIIEKVSRTAWQDAERRWIAHYRSIPEYPRLTNTTDGGEGVEGYIASEEFRKKQSENKKGVPMPVGHGAKVSAAHKGRIHTQESRHNMSKGKKERWITLTVDEKQKQLDNLHRGTKRSNNTSGFIGIRRSGKRSWYSFFKYRGIRHYLGTFGTPEDAARARDRKAIDIRGDAVALNFPRSDYQ